MPNKQDEINKIKINLKSEAYERLMRRIDRNQSLPLEIKSIFEGIIDEVGDEFFAAGYSMGQEIQTNK